MLGAFTDAQELLWLPASVNTTIVAATVVTVFDAQAETSTVTTIYNDLPDGYTTPTNRNSGGTQTTRVTVKDRNGVVLTTDM